MKCIITTFLTFFVFINATFLHQETKRNESKLKVIPLIIVNIEKAKNGEVLKNGDNADENNRSSAGTSTKFNNTMDEVRLLKIELFGNPHENMDFYKRNKNAYDVLILQRSTKIAKIMELENLLGLYSEIKSSRKDNTSIFDKKITEASKFHK